MKINSNGNNIPGEIEKKLSRGKNDGVMEKCNTKTIRIPSY